MAAAQAAEIGDVPLDIKRFHEKMVAEARGDSKEEGRAVGGLKLKVPRVAFSKKAPGAGRAKKLRSEDHLRVRRSDEVAAQSRSERDR